MEELLKLAIQAGGFGGLLAVLVFLMYRRDRRDSEKRLTHLLEQDQESRKENTKALIEMNTLLSRMNGKNK